MSEEDDATARQPWQPSPYPRRRPDDTTPQQDAAAEDIGEEVTTAESVDEHTSVADANDAEPKRGRARRIALLGARVAVALVSIVALLATGYGYTVVTSLRDSLHTADPIGELGNENDPSAPPERDNAIDILLVGTDARTDMAGNPLPPQTLDLLNTERSDGINTDTLIILRVPKDGSEPTAVSIPRDSWVKTPSGDHTKINSVFGKAKAQQAKRLRADSDNDGDRVARESDRAGRTELLKTVQQFTGVHIDHYAEVNLLGFYLLTKALGTVTVCLKQPTHDEDSGADFPAGVQELNAAEALSFVRQRKNLPQGLGRIHRQQAFLSAAVHQILSADTLGDSEKLDDLTDAAQRSMVLDPDLDPLRFAERIKDLASDDFSFETIPVRTINGHTSDGLSIVRVDADEVRDFMADLVDDPEESPAPTSGGGAAVQQHEFTTAEVPCVY